MEQPLPVVIVPGNGYSWRQMKSFVNYLDKQPWCDYVVYIELLENLYTDLCYEQLSPRAYSRYIYDRLPDKARKYIFYGTSMGCYHIQNFAADERYEDLVHSVVWLEPTMCGGNYRLLREFEAGRGNGEWLKSLYDIPHEIRSLPSNEKVIDIAISSDLQNDFDKDIPLGVIYAFYRNDGEAYNQLQLDAKDGFIDELQSRGHKLEFTEIDGPHSADVHEEYFPIIAEMIARVSF